MAYSVVDKPSKYFNTVLYTGTGASNSITGVGFKPDWVWIKDRSANAYNHALFDAVRGVTKLIQSNTTNAEQTTSGVSSFNTDGFTLGTDIGMNQSSVSFASWNWLGANTTVSNTSGTITSTVSANTTSGFSIVSWTANGSASTVGHGLGVAPSMIILKKRATAVDNWYVYHKSMGNTQYIYLDLTNAATTYALWNNTTPTSSVFSLGTWSGTTNGSTFIAYCFSEIKGYSKFGSYTGNGSADGTFIYTGFKPAYVMIKRTDSTGSWVVEDSIRSPTNSSMKVLFPNLSNAEETLDPYFDLLSNGFKTRSTSTFINASGGTYIYMAFAENPFVSSKGITTCAR
jgi:hypothetical protein